MNLNSLVFEKVGSVLGFVPSQHMLESGRISIDEIDMTISETQRSGQLVIAAEVASIPRHIRPHVLTLVMSANHCFRGTLGATFSFDPLAEKVYLCREITADDLIQFPAEQVAARFLDLYETAHYWRHVIDQLRSEGPELSDRGYSALSFGRSALALQ